MAVRFREAVAADLPRIVELGSHFLDQTGYRALLAANPEQMARTAASFVNDPEKVILLAERDERIIGMLLALVYDHPLSSERIGSELVWWVEPDARGCGLHLLRQAERWAKAHGAGVMQMVAPTPAVGRLYQSRDYVPVEQLWQRAL